MCIVFNKKAIVIMFNLQVPFKVLKDALKDAVKVLLDGYCAIFI